MLVTREVTYWGRLRVSLRQRWIFLALFGLLPLSLPAAFALAAVGTGHSPAILLWGSLATLALVFVPALISVVIGCAWPSPSESMLPRRLVLREDFIEVTPREGPPSQERWTWLVGAYETGRGFTLVLCASPRVEMNVPRSILSPLQNELLGRWLRQHDCLIPRANHTAPLLAPLTRR